MREEFKFVVVVICILGAQYLQPFFNGEVRTDDECCLWEAFIGDDFAPVAKCPCDEHRHDDGFTAAGRHFASVSDEVWDVGFVRCIYQLSEVFAGELWCETDPLAALSDFGEIDDRLYCLALAKKESL